MDKSFHPARYILLKYLERSAHNGTCVLICKTLKEQNPFTRSVASSPVSQLPHWFLREMNDPKDKPDPKSHDAADNIPAPDDSKRSGRVAFDSRGNPIWEWQLETGVYSRDVNTQKLKKLDLGDLSIAETGIMKKPEGLGDTEDTGKRKQPLPGGGFNPYDSGSRVTNEGGNPYDNARQLGKKLTATPPNQPAPPARKPMDLRKLDEWIKLKKNLKPQVDNDDD